MNEQSPDQNPFRGLQSYTERDAALFQKLRRGRDIEKLYSILTQDTPVYDLVILHGEPGVGKSSVFRAGLIPLLSGGAATPAPFMDIREYFTTDVLPPVEDNPNWIADALRDFIGSSPIVFIDQFEWLYEQNEPVWRAVLALLSDLYRSQKTKLVIGMRQEYLYRILEDTTADGVLYFADRARMHTMRLNRLTVQDAQDVITTLSNGRVDAEAAKEVVAAILQENDQPYTPHIQIVCLKLWEDVIVEQGKATITHGDIEQRQIKTYMHNYLDNVVGEIKAELRPDAMRMMSMLVRRTNTGTVVERPVTDVDIKRELSALDDKGLDAIYAVIGKKHRIVFEYEDARKDRRYRVAHDFIARAIYDKYNRQVVAARDEAVNFIQTLEMAARTTLDNAVRQSTVLSMVMDAHGRFYQQYYWRPANAEQIEPPEDSQEFVKWLTLPDSTEGGRQALREKLEELLANDAIPHRYDAAVLIVDCLIQMLLLFQRPQEAKEMGLNAARLLAKHNAPDAVQSAYTTDFVGAWQQVWRKTLPAADHAIIAAVLQVAQQQREHTIYALRDQLKLTSYLPLWRVLFHLWAIRREVRQPDPVTTDTWKTGYPALYSYTWTFVPAPATLEEFKARVDYRTYQGLIVHIPAGEHAMRNQRSARAMLIRTIAIEKNQRVRSPGWHEADHQEIVNSYKKADVEPLLTQLAQTYSVMLDEPTDRMWVVLEAQEYPIEDMYRAVSQVNAQLKREESTFRGEIVSDLGAAIANRKDLTRGLATLHECPQPDYRLIGPRTTGWNSIWRAMENHGKWIAMDEGFETASAAEQRTIWIEQVKAIVQELGGRAFIKPVTTEFLKGATPIDLSLEPEVVDDHLDRAWARINDMPHFPLTLVEERVHVDYEMMTVVVQRGTDGNEHLFVDVPPIFYRCYQDIAWDKDIKTRSVPTAMDYAWVGPHDDATASIQQEAIERSRALATALWYEVATVMRAVGGTQGGAEDLIQNRFLEFEWLVDDQQRLLLNEIKPTQLDKGIISQYAMNYSDSDLLVRNLFNLPLPESVELTQPDLFHVLGAIVTQDMRQDIPYIVSGGKLVAYGGIPEALDVADHVFLYPDKMLSTPYIGRRMGVVKVSAPTLEAAQDKLNRVRAVIQPKYIGEASTLKADDDGLAAGHNF